MKITIEFNTITDEELIAKAENIKSREDYFNLTDEYNEPTVIAACVQCGRMDSKYVNDMAAEIFLDFIADGYEWEEEN